MDGASEEMSLLKVEDISISFGGVMALNNISFEVNKGEIYAIIGPNGSGKTTIFNCINRIYTPQNGRIFFKDRDILRMKTHKICELGIARTFQNIELFSNMTVMENLLLGCHHSKKTNMLHEMLFPPKVVNQEIQFREKVEEVIDFLSLQPHRSERINALPFGVQKVVEMGRALSMEPELLLLDEPSGGLNPEEAEDMVFWIEDIKNIYKITVLIVEHNMQVIMQVSDRVCALNYGDAIAIGLPREIQSHPEVIKAYLGEDNGRDT
jgi:branched-chain amino acid transport system ATP-binding protein